MKKIFMVVMIILLALTSANAMTCKTKVKDHNTSR